MARERIIDFLPAVYHSILPEFFDRPLGEERFATCNECTMCPPPVPDLPADAYFSPSTKCCTFHPTLPNYLVGGLLDAAAPGVEGRRRIREKIARRAGVTPFGILPTARFQLMMNHGAPAFGRAESMVCPYLDREAGACTVWAERDSQCATWFCKHNHGEDGREFWTHLRDYLFETQRLLAAYALRELGFDADRILAGAVPPSQLDARAADDRPPSDGEHAAIWGSWFGREEELFLATRRIVDAVDRETYAELSGLRLDLQLSSLARRHDAIANPTLPDPLMKNPSMRIDRGADGSALLTSYRNGEPTRLTKSVYQLLDLFDGRRATEEVRAAVSALGGPRVSDSFLLALYHHRILVAPASTTYQASMMRRPATR